jgi:hypothetical protein
VAWIESHQELARHPKVGRLARTLGVSKVTAVGHLHFLWWWAIDFAPDGDLAEFSDPEIADGAAWENDGAQFVGALTDAGWLDGDRRIHDWMDYAGTLVAQRESYRAANRERQRRYRERHRDDSVTRDGGTRTATITLSNAPTVPDPTQPNHTEPKPLRATKRRVYAYTDAFEELWNAYPRDGRHDKPKAAAAFTRALTRADLDAIVAGAQRYADDPNRDPGHTKYAEGWLNGDRWNDPPLSAQTGRDPRPRDIAGERITRAAQAIRGGERDGDRTGGDARRALGVGVDADAGLQGRALDG